MILGFTLIRQGNHTAPQPCATLHLHWPPRPPQALALQLHLTCSCSSVLMPGLGIINPGRALQGDKGTIRALMEHGGPVLARTVDKDARRRAVRPLLLLEGQAAYFRALCILSGRAAADLLLNTQPVTQKMQGW